MDVIILALIAGAAPTILAAAAWYTALLSGRKADSAKVSADLARQMTEEAMGILVKTQAGIFDLGQSLDEQLRQLHKENSEAAAYAAGRRTGRDVPEREQ